jgi:ATP-binding cassette subfamily B protein
LVESVEVAAVAGDTDRLGSSDASRHHSMWRLYAEYGRANIGLAVLGTGATVLARATGLLPALVLGLAIDTILLRNRTFGIPLVPETALPTTAPRQLWLAAALLVSATAVGAGLSWVQNYSWNRFAQNIQHALRVDAYESLQSLDRAYFDRSRTGELLSILNNDVNQLESFLTDGVSSGLRILALVLGVGLIMTVLNPWLAAITLLAVPVLSLFTVVFVRRIQPKYARMRASVGDLNTRLENNVSGIDVIKTEHTESYESERVREASWSYYDANWDAIRTRITFFPGLSIISGLSFAMTFVIGSFWVLNGPPTPLSGAVTPGEFVTFMLYTQQFIWPLAQFGQIVNGYQRAAASSDRVYDLLHTDRSVVDPPAAITLEDADGRIEYDDVTFSYESETTANGMPVLRNLSFTVEPGTTLGIVGPTGSGKSTLVKLLVRLYDPDSGTIRLDGNALQELSVADLRRRIGYVSQEPFLFSGSVRDNVAYGTFDAADEEVEAAARKAAAHEFIANLPDGYDTLVGERGIRLSGGQRQRLALARTFLKDPDILILDEATSHVDTETEAIIQRSLATLAADRTTIAIAHRLSTVKNADEILVLEGGQIVERGTHTELLDLNGLYTNLWRVQSGDIDDLPASFFDAAIARRAAIEGGDVGE